MALLSPFDIKPVSKLPSLAVAECCIESLLVKVIASPFFTFICTGEKVKPWMSTLLVCATFADPDEALCLFASELWDAGEE
jgi:hypothetical protein